MSYLSRQKNDHSRTQLSASLTRVWSQHPRSLGNIWEPRSTASKPANRDTGRTAREPPGGGRRVGEGRAGLGAGTEVASSGHLGAGDREAQGRGPEGQGQFLWRTGLAVVWKGVRALTISLSGMERWGPLRRGLLAPLSATGSSSGSELPPQT